MFWEKKDTFHLRLSLLLLNDVHFISCDIFEVQKEPMEKYVFVLIYMNLLRTKFVLGKML